MHIYLKNANLSKKITDAPYKWLSVLDIYNYITLFGFVKSFDSIFHKFWASNLNSI